MNEVIGYEYEGRSNIGRIDFYIYSEKSAWSKLFHK